MELFARRKVHSVLLVDISVSGVLLQAPNVELDEGEAVLVRLCGLASAVAYVRWIADGWIGLEFRRQLHPSVKDFTLHEYGDAAQLLGALRDARAA